MQQPRAAEQRAQAARGRVGGRKTRDAAASPEAEQDVMELQIAIDAEGHMSVDGEAMDWEQVKNRIQQLSSHPSSRVVIQADEQCRLESVLKLMQAAAECKVEATISTLQLETKRTE